MSKRSALSYLASAIALLGLAGPVQADERDLSLQLTRTYEGNVITGAPMPLLIVAANRGPAATGVISWSDSRTATRVEIPIELPTGSTKAISAAVPRPNWGSPQVTLETNKGTLVAQAALPAGGFESTAGVLMIAQNSGDLTFLTKQKTKGQYGESLGTAVAYLQPVNALVRESDYGPVGAVVLGEGAERMSAPAVRALREYVLRGGHLILLGGASAPILTDPRFAPLLPFSALTPREITVDGRSVSAQVPTPRPGAVRLPNLAVPVLRSGYGLGRVTYVATNPLEGSPLPSRNRTLSVAIDPLRSTQLARNALSTNGQLVPYLEGVPGTNDPFNLQIPPTETIFIVLGIYFVVVIPVNFLVLRALKRLEWAWFSAPAISLLFAGVLFRNAGALYSAKEGTATHALIVSASGDPQALVVGSARMFFPNASHQPLTVENATFLSGTADSENDMYAYGDRQMKPIPLTLGPDPVVTGYDTNALEFRDMAFRQRLDLGGSIRLRKENGVYVVENGSHLTLRTVRLLDGTGTTLHAMAGTDLVPGARASFSGSRTELRDDPLASYARGHAVVTAEVEGPRVGPLAGEPVTSRTSTMIVVSEGS